MWQTQSVGPVRTAHISVLRTVNNLSDYKSVCSSYDLCHAGRHPHTHRQTALWPAYMNSWAKNLWHWHCSLSLHVNNDSHFWQSSSTVRVDGKILRAQNFQQFDCFRCRNKWLQTKSNLGHHCSCCYKWQLKDITLQRERETYTVAGTVSKE